MWHFPFLGGGTIPTCGPVTFMPRTVSSSFCAVDAGQAPPLTDGSHLQVPYVNCLAFRRGTSVN